VLEEAMATPELFDYIQSGIVKFCSAYQLHPFSTSRILTRKNIQLVQSAAPFNKWENIVYNSLPLTHPYQHNQVKELLNNVARQKLIPYLEAYARTPIKSLYFITLIIEDSRFLRYDIIEFAHNIKSVPLPLSCEGLEDTWANTLAKHIRSRLGRGPKSIKTIIMAEDLVIYIATGAFSPAVLDHAAHAHSEKASIQGIFRSVINEGLSLLHGAYDYSQCIDFDLVNNKFIVLVCKQDILTKLD